MKVLGELGLFIDKKEILREKKVFCRFAGRLETKFVSAFHHKTPSHF
jgi:hypothetical protein